MKTTSLGGNSAPKDLLIYHERLKSAEHLTAIVEQAQEIVSRFLGPK